MRTGTKVWKVFSSTAHLKHQLYPPIFLERFVPGSCIHCKWAGNSLDAADMAEGPREVQINN